MLMDHAPYSDTGVADGIEAENGSAGRRGAVRWTVVLPFYNERDYLPISLHSLADQRTGFRLILVDNGSTDGGAQVAEALCHLGGLDAVILTERRPGKVSALQSGVAAAATEFVATCDADTVYPPDYLERATALLDRPGVAAAVAATAAPEAHALTRHLAGWHMALAGRLLPQQCHNGGAGQVFRTDALAAAGGFDPRIWNWVLEDHEIMARIEQQGRIAYDRHFLCQPVTRPRSVSTIGWGIAERLRYHATDGGTRQAFFHEFLGPRLHGRSLSSDRLRRNVHYYEDLPERAELYPVRG